MPEERVELSWGCPRRILSPLRLPFRHSGARGNIRGKNKRTDWGAASVLLSSTGPTSDPPASALRSQPGPHPRGGRSHLTTLAPLRPHRVHPLHEPFAQLLIAGPLHRIEIPAHLPILVPLDFEHLLPAGPHAIHEPAD